MVLTEDAESSDCTYDKSLNETLSSEEGTPSPSSGFNFINFMGEDNDVIPLAKKAAALYADKMKVNERSLSSSELMRSRKSWNRDLIMLNGTCYRLFERLPKNK
jgi:hypothetical protein